MQYLYVLTSDPGDIYYEQFLLSASSFRLKMPDAQLVLLCDNKTRETLTGKRSEFEKLVSSVITAEAPGNMVQVEVSRWLKTSMRRLVSGDFLFIDCDTIITEDLSAITEQGMQFGACLDKHSLIERHGKNDQIYKNNRLLGFTSHLSNRHFNSGVIFCADTAETRRIFDRWHELWLFSSGKNIKRDQPAFNMAIYENSSLFTELDGVWNCQIAYNGLPYLTDSKIIHYFASDLSLRVSPFILASERIFSKIKDTGYIPDEALDLLKKPRAAFAPESRIIAGDDMIHTVNSALFESIYLLRKKNPALFNFINRICLAGKKITKSFIVSINKKKDGGIKYYN